MLTLARRSRRSIYSLSANGDEVRGYMGLGPNSCAQTGSGRPLGIGPVARGCPDVRWSSVFHYFHSVMEVPDFRSLRTSANFGSGAVVPDVRSCPIVRSLEGVSGRPVLVGRPLAVAFGWGFRLRTSGLDRSSGGCRFVGLPSS